MARWWIKRYIFNCFYLAFHSVIRNFAAEMMSKRFFGWMIVTLLTVSGTYGQVSEKSDSVWRAEQLREVNVSAHGTHAKSKGLVNTDFIGSGELLRAACCNLGESFTTNPSVDVNYADAATGAQQIKLLGLSGTYVQMLTENIPTIVVRRLPIR